MREVEGTDTIRGPANMLRRVRRATVVYLRRMQRALQLEELSDRDSILVGRAYLRLYRRLETTRRRYYFG